MMDHDKKLKMLTDAMVVYDSALPYKWSVNTYIQRAVAWIDCGYSTHEALLCIECGVSLDTLMRIDTLRVRLQRDSEDAVAPPLTG